MKGDPLPVNPMLQVSLEDFPTARSVTYLNSASISLMPRPALDRMIEFERMIASGGTIGFDEEAETQALEGARNEAAHLLNARGDEIAVLSSASQGLCSLAWSLNLKAGSNVVSTDADFPSVVYPWMRLAQEKGLEVRLAQNRDGVVSEADLEKLVDDHTAVISISHVEYGTGQRFDLRWLAELAHSHGALLVVDATQSAGLVPIDLSREGVDALVAGGYKGLLGPFGAAILYLREELIGKLTPSLVGWRSTPIPYDMDARTLPFAEGAKKFEFSTMSYSSTFGLAESMKYLRGLGRDNVSSHVLALTARLIQMIKSSCKLPETVILTPEDERSHASIASFRFKGRDQSAVAAALVKQNVIVSQRFNGVRFSFHVYNKEEDLHRAVQVLEELLAE
jgi:cysteine desulfurase/selenocysteine lyase